MSSINSTPSPSDMSTAPSPPATRHPCGSCQKHKVKCDRKSPCTRCLIYGSECKQPEDPKRAPRRASRKSHDINQRIRQLESSLEEMRKSMGAAVVLDQSSTTNTETKKEIFIKEEPLEASLGHLIIEDENSRYVSTSSWVNLVGEVSALSALLDDGSSNGGSPESGTQLVTSGLFRQQENLEGPSSPIGFEFLWQIFIQRVDPMMKILHIPSTQILVSALLSGSLESTFRTDCLFAAIKFSAITSLTNNECWTLGHSRSSLLKVYRKEVQDALSHANFLTSHSIITLEAFVMFLICNRRHEKPHTMWMLIGNAIRLAESLGVHRDGTFMKLSVLATEVRRRLWWNIRMLDVSCAEDCGFLPTHVYGADTQLPLNINDSDITPTDVEPPVARVGFTEMMWSLIKFELGNRLHGFHSCDGKTSMGVLTGDKDRIEEQKKAIADTRQYYEDNLFKHCSPEIPIQRIAASTGRLMFLKLDLVIQYPLFQRNSSANNISRALKDELSLISCQQLESVHETVHNPETSPFSWMLQTYVHWHPIAFLLNEILTATQYSDHLARTWRAVQWAITDPHGLEEEENLALWKPLESLIDKARVKMETFEVKLNSNEGSSHSQPQSTCFAFPNMDKFDPIINDARVTEGAPNNLPDEASVWTNPYSINPTVGSGSVPEACYPTLEDLMGPDLYQPFVTMDDFAMADTTSFDQIWWNEHLGTTI